MLQVFYSRKPTLKMMAHHQVIWTQIKNIAQRKKAEIEWQMIGVNKIFHSGIIMLIGLWYDAKAIYKNFALAQISIVRFFGAITFCQYLFSLVTANFLKRQKISHVLPAQALAIKISVKKWKNERLKKFRTPFVVFYNSKWNGWCWTNCLQWMWIRVKNCWQKRKKS